jgi:hypothetical protein
MVCALLAFCSGSCCVASLAGLLLVLPGSVNYTTMKLDWSKVTASVERFAVVSDYQEFHSQWQGFTKRHRWVAVWQI